MAPSGQRFHVAVAGIGFLLVNVVFWLAKFEVYQRIIFPVGTQGANTSDGSSTPGAEGMVALEPVP